MNLPSQVLGVEAVKDDAYFKATTAKMIATRERVKKELAELGFTSRTKHPIKYRVKWGIL